MNTTSTSIQLVDSNHKLEPELLKAFEYTTIWRSRSALQVYYNIDYYGERCGVCGDGANAWYEWFIWKDGRLQVSDDGFGCPEAALREVLNRLQ